LLGTQGGGSTCPGEARFQRVNENIFLGDFNIFKKQSETNLILWKIFAKPARVIWSSRNHVKKNTQR
jgi:hypothetical protein